MYWNSNYYNSDYYDSNYWVPVKIYYGSNYWNSNYWNSNYWGKPQYSLPGEIPDTGDSEELYKHIKKLDYARIFKDDDEILEILMMVLNLL
jgi:hypothetical protein